MANAIATAYAAAYRQRRLLVIAAGGLGGSAKATSCQLAACL